MPLRILHIAPFNTSDVPMTLVRAERAMGHYSRLVTLGRDPRCFEEDICLELPLLDWWGTRLAKRLFSDPERLRVDNVARVPEQLPPTWRPHGPVERMLVRLREALWSPAIRRAVRRHRLADFDVYQLDGGLEFTRDGRFIAQRKKEGKRIICCYTGSDLRTRGVIPAVDALADVRVTVEFDHLRLHPSIHHVFFPFEVERFEPRRERRPGPLRIGHAPTNRKAKGSDVIIPVLVALQEEWGVEMVLIEKLPYAEALRRKAECDIFVDQLGDLGYGINSLEALAMGIPVCSCLAPGFAERYPDHPFVVVDAGNLRQELVRLINDAGLRQRLGAAGRAWVLRYHDSRRVAAHIHRLAGLLA
ncbi:MAG: glycosyltransferase [candidate division KSB1 bacterium]|nr:glycosyltransferase [candidate division KSB1 bacterium]